MLYQCPYCQNQYKVLESYNIHIKKHHITQWLEEKHLCEHCNTVLTTYWGSGRFCNQKCANAHSLTTETKTKISNSVKITYRKKCLNKKEKTIHKCVICGSIDCDNEFCKKHNIQHFKYLSKYFGLDESKIGTSELFEEYDKLKDTLYDLYWNKSLSTGQISKMYNNPRIDSLANIFRKMGIPSKSQSRIVKDNILTGNLTMPQTSNVYKCGYHTSWEGKEFWLRSSYEFDYANELDSLKIPYEVECIRLYYFDSQNNTQRIAIPDFYLLKENRIVEIKSNYTYNKIEMDDKIKAYEDCGYKVSLILEHHIIYQS